MTEAVKLWDWTKSLSYEKNIPYTSFNCTSYSPWLISQFFGKFEDCILHANDLNMYKCVSDKAHFHFFQNIIRPKKRYTGKWVKAQPNEKLDILKERYPLESESKLLEALNILNDEDFEKIKKEIDKGGKK